MAAGWARRHLQGMDHHHLARTVAIWVSLLAGTGGASIAIFVGLWSAKRPGARGFDFAASARRVRTSPIPARNDA